MTFSKKYKIKPIEVRFWDHTQTEGGAPIQPLICNVIGYLVGETKLVYQVATWICSDDLNNQNNEAFAILKSTVIEKRYL